MVFSSSIFLFAFLPLVLIGCALLPSSLRNTFLLIASLFFYAWGEGVYVVVMIASILANYAFGFAVSPGRPARSRKVAMAGAVVVNIGALIAFKYANFIVGNLNLLLQAAGLHPIQMNPVHLPIGISFFTFQALSYVIDVYRSDVAVQKNPARMGLYIALFPQLIAGPIVRYIDVAAEIHQRRVTVDGFVMGVRRFVIGLAKKMLIANTVAIPADEIFALDPSSITTSMAWLAIVCYALQIYFDFSGYSDMAIGLGRAFGFNFLENFNYPYISRSLTEFWRRWHISLSTWFRDYLYIPLGGNRVSRVRTYVNLVIVFFLCGLWHGASWNFVAWGLFHGMFLVLERMIAWRRGGVIAAWLGHGYVLVAVLISWVLFRSESLTYALGFLQRMAGCGVVGTPAAYTTAYLLTPDVLLALVAGVIGATPVAKVLYARVCGRIAELRTQTTMLALAEYTTLACVVFLCMLKLASGSHNPFIYFRF